MSSIDRKIRHMRSRREAQKAKTDQKKQPDKQPDKQAGQAQVICELPVEDLAKPGGGAWKLDGSVTWKKSGVETREGQPVLRVFYGKNSGTSSDPGVGGIMFSSVPRGLPADAALAAFQVLFAPGWHFSKGGKIGGFHIGHGDASGYRHSDTAATHRIMWQEDGGAIAYVYPPSNLEQEDPKLRASGHGIGYFKDIFPAGTLRIGTWNEVQIGVKLNTFDGGKPRADGEARLTVNGATGTLRGVRWRRSPDLAISSLDFNTFFGGPDPAVTDCTAYFRGFKLLRWPA